MAIMSPEEVREALRKVPCPGRSRDIVALGFLKSVAVRDDAAFVEFMPDIQNVEKVLRMEESIRETLRGAGFAEIEIETEPPYDDTSMMLGGPSANPLQMDHGEYGIDPNPDLIEGPDGRGRARNLLDPEAPDADSPLTPEGDVDEFAAAQSEGPQGNSDSGYQGPLPVFQWEIDPEAPGGGISKVRLSIDAWNYVVSWIEHRREGLVYASIHARHWIRDGAEARPNPAGRTEAVNLVYDPGRGGVVAIYGTVRDFRQFVEAFRRAWPGDSATGQAHAAGAAGAAVSKTV